MTDILRLQPNGDRVLEFFDAIFGDENALGDELTGILWDIDFPDIDPETVLGRQLAALQASLDLSTLVRTLVTFMAEQHYQRPEHEVVPYVREGIERGVEHERLDAEVLTDLDRFLDEHGRGDASGPVAP